MLRFLSRYGGLDAVLAWTEQEQLLRASVAQWSVFQRPPHERWTDSIDGYRRETLGDAPARVVSALSAAFPLPTTITEAAAEYAMWERRDRDVGLAVEDTSDSQLDLPAYLRREIVRRSLDRAARDVADRGPDKVGANLLGHVRHPQAQLQEEKLS